ncbi:citrate synthase [Propionibacterium freudenreichii]|uniref:citrate synthase n=1 Tax=Propionibacterium freudenreichii TaxID=1744 RepID=UPI00254CD3D9|nr:citrate synthase [Propionibacterium freudenreichii]MDK9321202.1 citrate synthase [Propionibacterium freudenreichii]MDK9323353.1 citrate synthase [Propionibacterium freudenreichii]
MEHTAVLSGEGAKAELPIVESSVGSDGYDIRNLLRTTGNVTYDMGFANTASCQSAITYIDGEKGILRYRGYPIEQLADKSTFLETAYLVIYGELPRPAELADFEERIKRKTIIDEGMRKFFETFPRGSHPMPVLAAGVQALGTFSTTSIGDDAGSIEKATERLIAKMPTLAAYGYKNSRGEPFLYPDNALSYVQNFERMSFGYPTEPYHFEPEITRALDVLLILHADHEQNCSSSTVRLVGSSGANIYASISAGINALSGPLHGGANQAVLEMLEAIAASGISVKEYVQQVKDRKAGIKLMGFGHRIYKNYDPRAAIIKQHADRVLALKSGRRDLLDIAQELEQAALADDYFTERKLYPNVDFYSGLIYEAMGFPKEMFTVLFAIGRLPGWIAQWREQRADPKSRIGRPRQVYTGVPERDYVPMDDR